MYLPMKWLREFVTLPNHITPREYAEALTMSGSKVEGYSRQDEEISGVVIGKIITIDPHPDADRLRVCTLDVGQDEPLQIVTGADNVQPGDIVPVATDGSQLPGGVRIKSGKLRGVASQGMLCSVAELGCTAADFPGAVADGILIITEPCTIGDSATSALGLDDTIVEFEITSNRPDCLSVIGLARETAATFDLPLTLHRPEVKTVDEAINDRLNVTIEDKKCSRYMARMVKNVTVTPSPRWLCERLRASGVRSINNLVDITNYVMLEYGHPMHAFDLRYVGDHTIFVRHAKENETITTLDGVTHELDNDMLVIADSKKPVAVAGVMGGEYSGIMPDTDTVVFECACFHPFSVRATAQRLGLRTDSSARFEKGLDANACAAALDRACELVTMLGAGEVLDGVIDCHSTPLPQSPAIPLDADSINAFLGTTIPKADMITYLERLAFTVKDDLVRPPIGRVDIQCAADVAEEIARIYGYNNIATTAIRGSGAGALTYPQRCERDMLTALTAVGFSEIITYSFIGSKEYDRIGWPADDPRRRSVTIRNPLGADTSIMRTTALPSLCEALALNYNNRNPNAALFELAKIYLPEKDDTLLPDERRMLVLGAYGEDVDFFSVKGALWAALAALNLPALTVRPLTDNPSYHPGRCAEILCGDTIIGLLGELSPLVLENYKISARACAAELDFVAICSLRKQDQTYAPLPKFPAIKRDFALVCDVDTPAQTLYDAIVKGAGRLGEAVELFDVYTGDKVGEQKKSLAYTVTLRAADRTLTDEEAERATKKILKELDACGAILRQS